MDETSPKDGWPVLILQTNHCYGCLLQVPWCGISYLSTPSAIGCRSPPNMCWVVFCAVQGASHCSEALLSWIPMWLAPTLLCHQKPSTTFNMIKVGRENVTPCHHPCGFRNHRATQPAAHWGSAIIILPKGYLTSMQVPNTQELQMLITLLSEITITWLQEVSSF